MNLGFVSTHRPMSSLSDNNLKLSGKTVIFAIAVAITVVVGLLWYYNYSKRKGVVGEDGKEDFSTKAEKSAAVNNWWKEGSGMGQKTYTDFRKDFAGGVDIVDFFDSKKDNSK